MLKDLVLDHNHRVIIEAFTTYGSANQQEAFEVDRRHQYINQHQVLQPAYVVEKHLEDGTWSATLSLKKPVEIKEQDIWPWFGVYCRPFSDAVSLRATLLPQNKAGVIYNVARWADDFQDLTFSYRFKEEKSCKESGIPRFPFGLDGITWPGGNINASPILNDWEWVNMQTDNKPMYVQAIRFYREGLTRAEIKAFNVLLRRHEEISDVTVAYNKAARMHQVTYWFPKPHYCRADTFYLWFDDYRHIVPSDYAVVIKTHSGQQHEVFYGFPAPCFGEEYQLCDWPT